MKLYVGIDLHSNNNYICIINERDEIVLERCLANEKHGIERVLNGYKEDIDCIAVESTYNWYWLVDRLKELGYKVKLVNTVAVKQYSGLKYTDDRTDAKLLAHLLRLNILPTGYICPKEIRALRELLRKRLFLVKQRTMNLISLQSMIYRYAGIRASGNYIKSLTLETLEHCLTDHFVYKAGKSQLNLLRNLNSELLILEKELKKQLKHNHIAEKLKTIPGVGEILAATILLETGEISRFKAAGNYASYCRTVNSKCLSNGKKKGENNRKNGNKYLSWAFVEAAHFAIRYSEEIKKYYQKKMAKTNAIIAIKTVAHKLARAAYHIMKDEVEFSMSKLF